MSEISEQQRRDDKRLLLTIIRMRPIWDARLLTEYQQELLDELIDNGDVDYDVEAREFIAKR